MTFFNKNIVSVPRSGQHMTEPALRYYHELMKIPFSYCEYYNCCKTRPCSKKPGAYQKNHDHDLNSEINDNDKYLFLYRENLLQQIEANFRLHLRNNKIIENTSVKVDYTQPRMVNYFKIYVSNPKNKKYYKNIFKKYLNTNKSNVLPIEYDYYVNNFNETFKKILLFFDVEINDEFIEQTRIFINPKLEYKISKADSYYDSLEKFVMSQISN